MRKMKKQFYKIKEFKLILKNLKNTSTKLKTLKDEVYETEDVKLRFS